MNKAHKRVSEDWAHLLSNDKDLYSVRDLDHRFFSQCRSSRWVQEIIKKGLGGDLSTGLRVLEAGCANGKRSIAISTLGPRCIGLDYAWSMCTIGDKLAQAARQYWHDVQIEFVQGDIFQLPFADQSFDLVFNNGVVEHFTYREERIRVLREMARVTHPRGRVLASVPNGQHILENLWHKYLIHDGAIPEVLLSLDDLENEMREAGLDVVENAYWGVSDSFGQWLKYDILKLPTLLIDRMILHLCPGRIKQYFAFHIVCVGVKREG